MNPLPELQVNVEARGPTVIVHVSGEVDMGSEAVMRAALEAGVAPGCDLVLDLADVSFFGSSGLSVCVHVHHDVARVGGRFRLRRPSPVVARVLALTALDEVLEIEP